MKLTDENFRKIIDFSDRPYRIVEYMTAKQLHDLGAKGGNSFKADSPNAVLSADGVDASIIIIQGLEIREGDVVLMLAGSGPSLATKTQFKDVVVTVDNCALSGFCGALGCCGTKKNK